MLRKPGAACRKITREVDAPLRRSADSGTDWRSASCARNTADSELRCWIESAPLSIRSVSSPPLKPAAVCLIIGHDVGASSRHPHLEPGESARPQSSDSCFRARFLHNELPDMRALLLFAPLFGLLACGGKGEDSSSGGGGQGDTGGASSSSGGATATGGSNASAGTPASAGQPAGSSGEASGGSATSAAGAATGGNAGQGSGGGALVDCDVRKVACRVAQPICPENEVSSVTGSCFGPCVPIESCACSAAAECPFSDRYTCWQRTHCGPYVR